MAMHTVYINADAEARLALLAERLQCSVEYLIEMSAEEKGWQHFQGRDDDPAFKEPTDV